MKKHELRNVLETAIPEASPLFTAAMHKTLTGLVQEEAKRKETAPMKPIINKRRMLTIVLAALLLLAAVATAATLLARNVFEGTLGDSPQNAASLTQFNLAKERIGDAEITIKEAAYDGMSLYVLYSIRDTTATGPWGEEDETGVRYLNAQAYERVEALGVGWWWDNLWIDGTPVSMPDMSGGEDLAGEEPGEALYYMQYRLDREDLYLTGKNVEISMPIGQRQEFETLIRNEETGSIEKPEKGLVTFHLDCSSRENVVTEEPNVQMDGPRWSAKVARVVYSPIQMYVTLNWEIKPEVLAAYIAENGDGFYENGVKYWDYDGLEVCGGEIMTLQLVDKDGKPVFETMRGFYGCGGASASEAWYTFPYTEKYPEEMFLVPEINGELDMNQAIRVK